MKLSEQLSVLSDRTKKTEDTVDAALENNKTKLTAQRDGLRASATAAAAAAEQHAAAARTKVDGTSEAARVALQQRFASMKAHAEQRRTEHDISKAEHHAEVAEQDASDAIDVALYVLDQTQVAIVDAVIARADADDQAQSA